MEFNELRKVDPDVFSAMDKELERQENHLELIASENFVSLAVLEAMGSHLTNKYAEGYPGRRYYGGCEYVDIVEDLAIERAKTLFGAEHANVQPHSGSQANMAVYFAFLKPGDTILGMNLDHGGHLTHGSPVNISGSYFDIVSYGVDEETGYIDYEALESLAKEHRPKLIIAGASAYSREIDFKRFSQIAKEVSAYFLVDMAHIAGLVAAGLHPNPVEYADFVTSTTHKTLRGPRGGLILSKAEYAKAIDKAIFPGIQGGPLMHIIAGKAVSFLEAMKPEFKEYQKNIIKNAEALAKALSEYGFDIVSGGTDTHLLNINLINKGITGRDAERILDSMHITTNKNTIPNDPQSPFVTSGIRIGTPAVTTRGMGVEEMKSIAKAIFLALDNPEENEDEVKAIVAKLCEDFPLYK